MEQKLKENFLGVVPISKLLLKIGIPAMIGMVITALYNLVDAAFVSGLGNANLGAITITFPIGQLIAAFGLLFGSGAGSYISRLLGKKDLKEACKVTSTCLFLSICFGILVILILYIFITPILKVLGSTNSILPLAKQYSNYYLISLLFNLFNITMTNIVVSEGKANISVFANVLGAIINIILDPIFIYVLNLGISGAAIATIISQIISTLVFLHFLIYGNGQLKFSIQFISLNKSIISEILKIGIPTFFFQVLTSLSICLINVSAKEYGDSTIAALGVVARIMTVGNLIIFGFTKGLQPIVGYNFGAKKFDRVIEAIKKSNLWCGVFCIGFAMILIVFSNPIIKAFSKKETMMIDVGEKALWLNAISFLVFGFYTVYQTVFLAIGRAKIGAILGVSRQGLFFIPLILLLPIFFKVDGIIFSQPIANILASLLTVFYVIGFNREIKALTNEKNVEV